MPVLLVATIALLVCIPSLAIVSASWSGARASSAVGTPQRGGRVTVVICVVGAAIWLCVSVAVPDVTPSALRWPVAALAAVAAYLCSVAVRQLGASSARTIGFTALWILIVFAPAAVLVFFPGTVGLTVSSSVWDLGGALPAHAASGAVALALVHRARRQAARGGGIPMPPADTAGSRSFGGSRSVAVTVAAAIVLWASWIAALVGTDLAIDSATPSIVVSGLIIPATAVLGWLLVERIRHHQTTLRGALGGLVCGLVAATAVGGSIGEPWAVALGLTAGVVCASWATRGANVRRAGSSAASAESGDQLVAIHLVAAVIGLLWIGLFGAGGGFVYTGQLTVVQVQIAATVAVCVWSYGVAAVLARLLGARSAVVEAGGASETVAARDIPLR